MKDEFLEYLKVVKKYSSKTIISYQKDIEEFLSFLQENHYQEFEIDKEIVRLYLEQLHHLKKSSIGRHLSSLRSYYNYVLKNNKIKYNYFKEVKNPKKEKTLPHYLTKQNTTSIFDNMTVKNAYDQRNNAIIELLYASGVRVSELVSIQIKDIDFSNNSIKILGKGSKQRYVIFGAYCEEKLKLYIQDGREELRKNKKTSYLFLNKEGEKLSDRYVRNIIKKFALENHLSKDISPHTFRHTFATDMLNNGADLMTVKELLGHSSLSTTSIYTHITSERLKEVYNQAHPRAMERK